MYYCCALVLLTLMYSCNGVLYLNEMPGITAIVMFIVDIDTRVNNDMYEAHNECQAKAFCDTMFLQTGFAGFHPLLRSAVKCHIKEVEHIRADIDNDLQGHHKYDPHEVSLVLTIAVNVDLQAVDEMHESGEIDEESFRHLWSVMNLWNAVWRRNTMHGVLNPGLFELVRHNMLQCMSCNGDPLRCGDDNGGMAWDWYEKLIHNGISGRFKVPGALKVWCEVFLPFVFPVSYLLLRSSWPVEIVLLLMFVTTLVGIVLWQCVRCMCAKH